VKRRCEGDLAVRCSVDQDCVDASVAGPCLGFEALEDVSLVDAFEPAVFTVNKPKLLCPPVDVLAEPGGLIDSEVHMKGYQLKRTDRIKHTRQTVLVDDQFGLHVLQTLKGSMLLAPTAKDLTGPVAAPLPGHDDYKCYNVKEVKKRCTGDLVTKCTQDADCATAGGICHVGHPKGLQEDLVDQFDGSTVELKKPKMLCVPVEKTAPVINPIDHLTCYQIKRSDGLKHTKVDDIHLNNEQFGPEVVSTVKEQFLCVSSVIVP